LRIALVTAGISAGCSTLTDIENIRGIHAVVFDGVLQSRVELVALLLEAERAAANDQ
jgi:hypothetical protein